MYFFYNLDTGEIRFEKHQVLLDLEPKLVCSNCYSYLAEVQRKECEEFFLTQSWGFILLGGRRASIYLELSMTAMEQEKIMLRAIVEVYYDGGQWIAS